MAKVTVRLRFGHPSGKMPALLADGRCEMFTPEGVVLDEALVTPDMRRISWFVIEAGAGDLGPEAGEQEPVGLTAMRDLAHAVMTPPVEEPEKPAAAKKPASRKKTGK